MKTTNKSSNEVTTGSGNHAIVVASVLVAAVSFLAYAPTLNSYFNAEDFGTVQLHWNDTFTHWLTTVFDDYTQGIWGFRCPSMRPVEALDYFVESRLWLGNPLGYHLSNLFVHVLSSMLVLWIAWRMTPAGLAAGTVAGMLFAVHASHVEAVSWISGRTDLIPSCFILLTVFCFGLYRANGRNRFLVSSLAFAALSFLTKEIAVTVPFLLLGYDALVARRSDERGWSSRYRVHAAYFVMLLVYLAIRWSSFGTPVSNWMNPAGAVNRQMIADFVVGQARLLNLLVLPVNVFEIRVREAWLLLPSIALLLAPAVALWRFRHRPAVAEIKMSCIYFGLVWYAVTIAPLVFAPASSRYLYLTSAGFCIAVPLLLGRLLSRKAALSAALAGLVLMSGLLLWENLRWRRVMAMGSSIQSEVVRLSTEIPDHGKILLDVPVDVEGIELWEWSLPFAFEPPFAPSGLSDRVLEKPEMYYHEGLWARDRAALMSAIESQPANNYVVRVDARGRAYSVPLAADEVDDILRRFRAGGRWWNSKSGPSG